jgi:hypothetical protein
MISPIQIISILASIFIIVFILSLIRQRKLREEYSIMWLVGSLALILFSIWRGLLDIIANLVGVVYAPAILLLIGIFFGVVMFLHFTVVLSIQADRNKSLTQELALLRNRIEELERSGD